jgi:hypothetical protein
MGVHWTERGLGELGPMGGVGSGGARVCCPAHVAWRPAPTQRALFLQPLADMPVLDFLLRPKLLSAARSRPLGKQDRLSEKPES